MLVYTAAIVVIGLIYALLNRKNKISYAFAICFVSIAFLMLLAVIYVSKIGNYTYTGKYDYRLYQMMYRASISIFRISDFFYLCLSMYMIGIFLMYHILDMKKSIIKDGVHVIIIFAFFIINSSYFSLELNRMMYEQGTNAAFIKGLADTLPKISEAAVLFYFFFIPCILIKKAVDSNLSFKRKYILLIVLCQLVMSLCVYAFIINGMAKDLNFHNLDLRRFPIIQSEYENNVTSPIIMFMTLLVISVMTFYYKPLEAVYLKGANKPVRDQILVNNNFSMYLHTYKNAFNSVNKIADLIEEADKNGEHDTLEDCVQMLKKLSQERIEHIDRLSGVLNARKVNFENVDLTECVEEALKKSEINKNITCDVKYEQDNAYVYGDRQIITEIFLNLINNAVTAMNKKMQQKDYTAKLDIKMWNEEEYIIVTVRDNGVGIDKSDFKNIFKMFYSTNERQKYCGVGLRTVDIGVRMHKGYIYVDSAVGKYAEFTVILPCLRQGRHLWKE